MATPLPMVSDLPRSPAFWMCHGTDGMSFSWSNLSCIGWIIPCPVLGKKLCVCHQKRDVFKVTNTLVLSQTYLGDPWMQWWQCKLSSWICTRNCFNASLLLKASESNGFSSKLVALKLAINLRLLWIISNKSCMSSYIYVNIYIYIYIYIYI